MESIQYYNYFKMNSCTQEGKKASKECLAGLFLCALGITASVYGQKMGLNSRNARLLTGGIAASVGVGLIGHGASTLLRSVDSKGLTPLVVRELRYIFENSLYPYETLPKYQNSETEVHITERSCKKDPSLDAMKHPVEWGIDKEGRHFFAIKVEYAISDATKQSLIVLCEKYPTQDYQLAHWYQLNRNESIRPQFFIDGMINLAAIDARMRDSYEPIKALLKTGSSEDLKSRIWRILK